MGNHSEMRDLDIRLALLTHLHRLHAGDPETLVVEEVGVLQGQSRVDLAVVNGRIHGYEIKSQRDTLSRLTGQLRDYGCVFDEVTVVIGLKHLTGVLSELPSWCGIILAHWVEGQVTLEPFREARQNLHRDAYSLAQLLWRDEAVEVLERHGCLSGVKSKPRTALWKRLADSLALEDLAVEVRDALKARKSKWRLATKKRRRPRARTRARRAS
jgi:hypothetical protein